MEAYEKIARILRVDRDVTRALEERLSAITGKSRVLDHIIQKNEEAMSDRLVRLGVRRDTSAREVYEALIHKMGADDHALAAFLDGPQAGTLAGCQLMINGIHKLAGTPRGFFIKLDKARELIQKEPPPTIMKLLGYANVNDLLDKEDLFDIWSALRFIEGSKWLNTTFFPHYRDLTPEDFEERDVEIRVLSDKWREAAEGFVKKKYHNISHLKELGVIFVIPVTLGIPGELLRNFNLLLHYVNEIPFYSGIFRRFARDPETFVANISSLLRGDVLDSRPPASNDGKFQWLVVQRYLSKDDENDWRLFAPHVNPEALHWERAVRTFIGGARFLDHNSLDFSFWHDLNWVGDFFRTDTGIDALVSFNLVDTAMSLVQEKELVKYLYHHQEALWNKIFTEYMSEEEMERLIQENIVKGYFEV